MENTKTYNHLTVPAAIIIAGAIIAIAIIWNKQPSTTTKAPEEKRVTVNLSAITTADHIFGNPDAAIKIVEYSDPSCPYCKTFNPTMEDIINKYGPTGEVAWIYRHFPLNKPDANGNVLHPNAMNESQALECAASVGGNDKFWAFEKKLYEVTPSVTSQSPKGLDPAQLPIIAKSVGIDTKAFSECLSSGKFADTVNKEYLSGINAGVSGTPSNFLVLNKPANKSVKTFIDNTVVTNSLPPSLLYITDDMKTIVMAGAMPKELIVGLISAIQADK
ncbi:MAG: thioredoxin domain-containing protein [Candidatus Taylorbacteria bacterium]